MAISKALQMAPVILALIFGGVIIGYSMIKEQQRKEAEQVEQIREERKREEQQQEEAERKKQDEEQRRRKEAERVAEEKKRQEEKKKAEDANRQLQGQRWEPVSNAILRFGVMTVSLNRISWQSGQSSEYRDFLDSEDGGEIIIFLITAPKFDGTPCRYVKLSRDNNEMLVSFYKTKVDIQLDNVFMEGTYEFMRR
jgi:vacuolar-type H+-ATPase subunit I/STV1